MMVKEANTEKATFAGGCFWCTEAIFKRLRGVVKVESGYAGGDKDQPSYEQVSSGTTGHAEAVQITFDPTLIPYQKLVEIFWAIHDPTTLNRQGADVGSRYRSMIFYHDQQQRQEAEASKERLEKSGQYSGRVVTEIVPFNNFYKAEDYHQNYYDLNYAKNSYCPLVIDPKIFKLLKEFGDDVKDKYKQARD